MAPSLPLLRAWGWTNGNTLKHNTKGKVIKPPRDPKPAHKRYYTDRYIAFNILTKNNARAVTKSQRCAFNFDMYDGYALVTSPHVTTEEDFLEALNNGTIPKAGVRLDDHLCGLAAISLTDPQLRHHYFPAEFDKNGMIRASRIPLGQASKSWRRAGERDLNGHILLDAEEGYYYDWYAGIHPLMGQEGYDQGWYLIRPSWEDKVNENTLGFKVGFPAL